MTDQASLEIWSPAPVALRSASSRMSGFFKFKPSTWETGVRPPHVGLVLWAGVGVVDTGGGRNTTAATLRLSTLSFYPILASGIEKRDKEERRRRKDEVPRGMHAVKCRCSRKPFENPDPCGFSHEIQTRLRIGARLMGKDILLQSLASRHRQAAERDADLIPLFLLARPAPRDFARD